MIYVVPSTYKPFRKPNDTPSYIHVQSNHSPNVLRELPKMVNSRLCGISSNEKVFNEAAPAYQAALKKSGHSHKLEYERPRPKNRRRKRVITWFNPPFNLACTVNLGREFLKLIDEHFPQNKPRKDKLEKIMNRHTIKLSYSGTQSMERIISSHNTKILNERREDVKASKMCNCQKGQKSCPVDAQCLTSAVVYKATVTASDGDVRTYTGSTDRKFKERLYENRTDANNRSHRHNTKLAGYVWEKKDAGRSIDNVRWQLLKKCHKYEPGGRMCDVCLSEKLSIMKNREHNSLNQRSELMHRCIHKSRRTLSSVKES